MKIAELSGLKAFVKKQRSCVLAVTFKQNKVHAAAILYVTDPEFKAFYFGTSLGSDKCESFRSGQEKVEAAIVVGSEPGTPYSLQIRGSLCIVEDRVELIEFSKGLQKKHGDKHWVESMVLLKFIPEEGKYTDYSIGWEKHTLSFD